jgi:predicted ATPase
VKITRLTLTNFLSYRESTVDLGDLVALVGPNASGKSNAVASVKLLHDIPTYGLPTALARRGGFDQLRHRSEGRPYDPAIALEFSLGDGLAPSLYELKLGAIAGKRYEVKVERGEVHARYGDFSFEHARGRVSVSVKSTEENYSEHDDDSDVGRLPDDFDVPDSFEVPDGQSALPVAASFGGLIEIWRLLSDLQIVEINPARVREFQDPSPGLELEPDGSNTASVFESLDVATRQQVIDELAAIVPGIVSISPRRFSNKLSIAFQQEVAGARREFLANQMSDGTLRAFGILLGLVRPGRARLMVVEEPEVAIHLGALRTLVEILRAHSAEVQILLTTHSADIIDSLDVDELRVVWSESGFSHISPVATHTRENLRRGLITPGELLRADALDPALA